MIRETVVVIVSFFYTRYSKLHLIVQFLNSTIIRLNGAKIVLNGAKNRPLGTKIAPNNIDYNIDYKSRYIIVCLLKTKALCCVFSTTGCR